MFRYICWVMSSTFLVSAFVNLVNFNCQITGTNLKEEVQECDSVIYLILLQRRYAIILHKSLYKHILTYAMTVFSIIGPERSYDRKCRSLGHINNIFHRCDKASEV